LSLAVFAPMRATAVMAANPEVDVWAIGGHSLGGAMAARYVYADAGAADGLVLWAAYPAATDDLSQRSDLAALSVYGTRDGLMTAVEREASRSLMPQNTCWVAIEGGNHAQFGDYGVQARDNAPTISMAHQHAEVVAATSSFLMMLDGMAVGESFNCSSLGGVQ
jgi:dienelactone hydrolase